MKHSISSRKSGQNGKLNTDKNTSLEHHFSEVKQENYSSTFPEVENWIYKANISLSNEKIKERKLHRMKNFFFANKLRLVYTIIAFIAVVAACNMPVTQTESAGQVITLVVPKDNSGFEVKMYALPWMKDAQVTQNENVNNGSAQLLYRIVLQNTSKEQVMDYSRELESLGDIVTIQITPMNYDVKRPLYSAALNNFFRIDIDATGMSDEELQNELESKLKEQGIDMKFKFKTGPEGRRDLTVENSGLDSIKEPRSFELNIEDDNGREKVKLLTQKVDPKKFEGKTDAEIRDIVRKDIGKPELTDDEIKITRENGEVKIKIEVNKTNKK